MTLMRLKTEEVVRRLLPDPLQHLEVRAQLTPSGDLWFGASDNGFRPSRQESRFDCNVRLYRPTQTDQLTCYLVDIALQPGLRGSGLGSLLYERIIEIASELGCHDVVTSPSGWTTTGESRRDWLLRRGWSPRGSGFYKLHKLCERKAAT